MKIKKTKKVAFIISKFPRLSETFVLNEIIGTIKNGFDVRIIARPGKDEKIHPDVKNFKLFDKFHAYTIPKSKILKYLKIMITFIQLLFINPFILAAIIKNRNTINLQAILLSTYFLKHNDFDIIYCHFGNNGRIAAFLKKTGIIKSKIITVFHGFDISEKKFTKKGYYDLLFKIGDLFLVISNYWKIKLINMGCDKKKVILHRMGIDCEKFVLIKNNTYKNNVKLLTIARFTPKKGIKYAIKAFYEVIHTYKPQASIHYTIIGDGELKEELVQLVSDLDLKNSIHFLGWMNHEEVNSIMKKSNIMILPSVTAENGDMEGIPVVLMEAMAMGLPILSTFHSGIPELVENGKTGFLVPERDVNSLAERLVYLIQNPELWKKMGQNGRKKIEAEFNNMKLHEQLSHIFNNI